jgi:hypothetical protein
MPDLRLSDDDASELREVLRSYLSDLRMEIADTEDFSLRERLKATEHLLKRLIGQLGDAAS